MKKSVRKQCRKRWVLMLFAVVFLLSICLTYAGISKAFYTSHNFLYTVVIDAGHGGIDAGVLGITTKIKESDLNLEIAKKLKLQFENAGIKVVMTRMGYGGLYGTTAKGFKLRDLKARQKIINSANADAFISVHLNFYSDKSCRGAMVFFGEDGQSKELAHTLQNFLNRLSGQKRQLEALKGDYYLLNTANCPAVICECGFLSNSEEEKLLVTESYQQEIAQNIFQGVISYLLA